MTSASGVWSYWPRCYWGGPIPAGNLRRRAHQARAYDPRPALVWVGCRQRKRSTIGKRPASAMLPHLRVVRT